MKLMVFLMVSFELKIMLFEAASINEQRSDISKFHSKVAEIDTKKININKIDQMLFSFISLCKKINEMKAEKEFNLEKFLDIHDQLFQNFDGNSPIEKKIFNIVMKLLKEYLDQSNLNISLNKLKSRAFRWG